MDGGTAGAQAECIADIGKHLTGGDFTKAEHIFNKLIRNGVAGLGSGRRIGADSQSRQPVTANNQLSQQEELPEDPRTKAMKAAEALDLETAFLQPGSDEIDLAAMARPRSMSVPTHRMADDFQHIAPFYVFGARRTLKGINRGSRRPRSPHQSCSSRDSHMVVRRATDSVVYRAAGPQSHYSCPDDAGEEYAETGLSPASADLSSPHSLGFESTSTTPVGICEALAVDVRSSTLTSTITALHKRTKSVDRVYTSAIRNQDISLPLPSQLSSPSDSPVPAPSQQEKAMPQSSLPGKIPRPTFGTPSRTIIRRSPPSPLKLSDQIKRPTCYVDRGTNTGYTYEDRSTSTDSAPAGPEPDTGAHISRKFEHNTELDTRGHFEPVLPMFEDLIIHFRDEESDLQLRNMIQAFKEGIYPKSTWPSVSEAETDRSQPSIQSSCQPNAAPPAASEVQHGEVHRSDMDEYDPFAYEERFRSFRFSPSKRHTGSDKPSTPPTPVQTPPPPISKKPERFFHEFTTTGCRTAVCMQNSLRSVLNLYFPPEDAGYHQFTFPLLPELSSLWKPVFRETSSGADCSGVKRRRKVDLIVAIGAQKGVNRDFLGAISGSLEKLGTKPNGFTRSGRLDLRFLIANTMQAFTSQPLTNQTQDNPFSNPLLLATLIIPHLETYMAANSTTRFLLLEYPPEHLTTVLALQRLVGVDLLKVAGILDSEANQPRPYPGFKVPPRTSAHSPQNSGSGILAAGKRADATLLTPPGTKQAEMPSFSKANFLLTSSANESEIATLISTIWKILIDISTFYIPEGAAPESSPREDPESKQESKRESLSGSLAQTPLIDPALQYAPLAGATALLDLSRRAGDAPPSENYLSADPPFRRTSKCSTRREAPPESPKGSLSETTKSSRTVKSMRSQKNKLRIVLGREVDADAVTIQSDSPSASASADESWDDEDDGLFAEERKYIPLYGKRGGPRKGNSHKALKWLGLATL
ncbi:hypothetical protein GGS23DRAFT_620053 [Durotheca rogersii]|uniref:uncharacterized protein n=1 Tax=Durotheca rogersii TaxID=419775 RepID=UPI0022205B76|nr:uncharacterized protein GGS23DRAFT_620053 [Durotheca rogersii]KAI5864259.1 hypothetical protein GGS23DRAFT_620053 [Durotheca rogersii]